MDEHDEDQHAEDDRPEDPSDSSVEHEHEETVRSRAAKVPARVRAAAPAVARKSTLAAALAWLGVSTALPLILIAWLVSLAVSAVVVAESLEETDGLVETTFGAGFITGAVLVVGLLAALIGLRVFGSEKSKRFRKLVARPFAIPAATLLAASVFSVVVEDGGTDLPDILTTAALLGLWDFVFFLLPIWLGLAAVDVARRTWRWAGAGPYRSGLVTGLAVAGGLLLPMASALLATHDEPDLSPKLQALIDRLDGVRETGNVIDDTHAVFVAIAQPTGIQARSKTSPPIPRRVVRSPFEECAEELAEPRAKASSERDLAIRRLVRAGHRREDAEDVAQLTIVIVCEKYANGEVRDYVPYFVVAVRRNATNQSARDRLIACDPSDLPEIPVWAAPAGGSEFRDAERAFCGLNERDRKLIFAGAAGYTGEELAEQLGVSAATARQRLSRARANLRAGM